MKKTNKKGFTLVELIVVIVIIAILAAALVTSLVGYITKAQDTTALTEANNVYTAAQAYCSEKGCASITGIGDGNNKIAEATIIKAINDYLGSSVVGTGDITVFTTDFNSTIKTFTYVASNNKTVVYDGATWDVN